VKTFFSKRVLLLSASFSGMALAACSSEPEASADRSTVPAYTEPGGTGTANPPAGTATPPSGAAPGSNESTQVNQLAPPPPSGTGAGNQPAPNMPQTPPAQQTPTPAPTPMDPPDQMNPTPGSPSAGCGAAQGMPANPATIADPNTIVTFPPGYDGSTPFPIVFAFHGAGRTNQEMRTVDSRTPGTQLENNYVMAFVKSQGNAWDLGTDYPRFQRLITQLLAERCIDTSHIFAMGHSSGAQFIVAMLGDNRARETRFAAVAPVSSNNLNNPNWNPLPTLLIHGLRDTARPNDPDGAQDISQYAESNQCSEDTQPVDIGTCTSLVRNASVNPGCVQYSGCAAPTLFCNHDDPNYNDGMDTNHGWPCFANSEIFTFFEATR
jgi:polyhydroxybutyrate depolymerase